MILNHRKIGQSVQMLMYPYPTIFSCSSHSLFGRGFYIRGLYPTFRLVEEAGNRGGGYSHVLKSLTLGLIFKNVQVRTVRVRGLRLRTAQSDSQEILFGDSS